MNLYDLARRQDANLRLDGQIVPAKHSFADGVWRGVSVPSGASFSIVDIRRFVSFRHFPSQVGWQIEVPPLGKARFRLLAHADRTMLGEVEYGEGFHIVTIPWPSVPCGQIDLEVAYLGQGAQRLFVAAHRLLSPQWLYDHCKGKGIELGPGPVPQILPEPDREVSYLEQMPAEEWNRLYNGGGKYPVRPELWSSYIVGEASDLPVPDGSLDFIFGSHVFEHLANPIGHLRRWHTKLKSGGKVAMVVPDLHGTKDSVHHRCSIESMVDEFQRDIWAPEPMHFGRHLRRALNDPRLVEFMERGESIHVHYYDNINCQQVLDFAVRELGYVDYIINHTPNHKDFHFLLVR